MRSVTPMRTAKIGYIVLSAALIVLGTILIVFPEFSVDFVGIVCGVLLVVFGAVRLIGYFSKDLYRLAFQNDLVFGIVTAVLGAVIISHPSGLMSFVCIALGLLIFADGVTKIGMSVEARKFGIPRWWMILILAVISALLGIVLMLRPGEGAAALTVILGVTLISEGLLSLCTVITAVKIIRHQRPEIKGEYKEIYDSEEKN